MSLFIITRMREGAFEFPDEFALHNNQPYFCCPDREVWVFEGSLIYKKFMKEDDDGTLVPDFEALYQYLEQLPAMHVPQKHPEHVYILIHDRYTVTKMKELNHLPWLERYETPRHLDDTDGAAKYAQISEIVAQAANQRPAPALLQSILCTYFYVPFLDTAVSNFVQHFGGKSLGTLDFQRDILKSSAPPPAQLQAPVAALQQLFSHYLPDYEPPPLSQPPATFPDLKKELAGFQAPCKT